MPTRIPGESLTLAEVRALSWAVKRANENSCVMKDTSEPGGAVFTRSGHVHPNKAYNLRVKLARRALGKVHELRRQGL